MVPRASHVQEYLELAKGFFVKIYNELYEFDFLDFRYWDTIKNEDLRVLLREADEVLQKGDALLCFAGVNLAYDFAVEALKADLFKSKKIADEIRFPSYYRRIKDNEMRHFAEELIRSVDIRLDTLYTQTVREQLGLSKESDEKFNKVRYGISASMSLGGKLYVVFNRDPSNFKTEGAKFALSYIYDLIMRIEEKYPGSLDTVRIPGSLLQVSLMDA
jgi:hypothetical protein